MAASGDAGQFLGRPFFIFNNEVTGLEDGVEVAMVEVSIPTDEILFSSENALMKSRKSLFEWENYVSTVDC